MKPATRWACSAAGVVLRLLIIIVSVAALLVWLPVALLLGWLDMKMGWAKLDLTDAAALKGLTPAGEAEVQGFADWRSPFEPKPEHSTPPQPAAPAKPSPDRWTLQLEPKTITTTDDTLARAIADDSARADIETECSQTVRDGLLWWDTSCKPPASDQEDELLARSVVYLFRTGAIVQHPEAAHLIRFV